MLGGEGYFRGSSDPGLRHGRHRQDEPRRPLCRCPCRRGERCLYFAFEESQSQIVRNMRSIGLDLEPMDQKGLLHFHNVRPSLHGMEMHLAGDLQAAQNFQPQAVVIDPLTAFLGAGTAIEKTAC